MAVWARVGVLVKFLRKMDAGIMLWEPEKL